MGSDRSLARGKIIFVVRNVIDIASSYFYHYNDIAQNWEREVTWDDFLEMFLAGNVMFGNYFDHVASWFRYSGNEKVLLLRYEELLQDTLKESRRIAAFLGYNDIADERLREIISETSFEAMKKKEMTLWLRLKFFFGVRHFFHVRNGMTGKGAAMLTVIQ